MYKFVSVLLLVALICPQTWAEEHTIRGTHWGMTIEQVKAIEKWEYVTETGDFLFYSGELKPGVDTKLSYGFHNGLLVVISYRLDKNKSTYQFLHSILSEKYGKPYDERPEKERASQVRELKEYGQHSIARLADFVYAYWKIHTSKDAPQTHLSIHFRSSSDVRIDYVNLEYKNQTEQAAKDKERDANYSLKNSDDL